MTVKVKICGLKTKEAIETAQNNGAEFLGFIFAPKSPRYITPQQAAEIQGAAKVAKVAVVVDATNEELDAITANLKPQYIQLHGNESETRAQEIKDRYGLKLLRALSPNEQLTKPELYDFLLFDSPGGGTGKQFDYTNFTAPKQPWFLSGGLNAQNIEEALKITGAKLVDISSGVESTRGVKDLNKITEFLKLAKTL